MRRAILILLEVLDALFLSSWLYNPTTSWGYNIKATIVLLGIIACFVEAGWWLVRHAKGEKGFGLKG